MRRRREVLGGGEGWLLTTLTMIAILYPDYACLPPVSLLGAKSRRTKGFLRTRLVAVASIEAQPRLRLTIVAIRRYMPSFPHTTDSASNRAKRYDMFYTQHHGDAKAKWTDFI